LHEEEIMDHTSAAANPEHRVSFERSPKRVRITIADTTIADTVNAGLMFETGHRPVYYFPLEDVRMDLLERTEHRTHCPHRGTRPTGRLRWEIGKSKTQHGAINTHWPK
jgi:uncharacterized protein (DUF427 family)